jgi:hypothetical protein
MCLNKTTIKPHRNIVLYYLQLSIYFPFSSVNREKAFLSAPSSLFHLYIILCFGQMESQNLFIAVGIFFKFMLISDVFFCFLNC